MSLRNSNGSARLSMGSVVAEYELLSKKNAELEKKNKELKQSLDEALAFAKQKLSKVVAGLEDTEKSVLKNVSDKDLVEIVRASLTPTSLEQKQAPAVPTSASVSVAPESVAVPPMFPRMPSHEDIFAALERSESRRASTSRRQSTEIKSAAAKTEAASSEAPGSHSRTHSQSIVLPLPAPTSVVLDGDAHNHNRAQSLPVFITGSEGKEEQKHAAHTKRVQSYTSAEILKATSRFALAPIAVEFADDSTKSTATPARSVTSSCSTALPLVDAVPVEPEDTLVVELVDSTHRVSPTNR